MRLGEAAIDSQRIVRWPWLQKSLVEDNDGEDRRKNGPNVQDCVVESSNATTAIRNVT